MYNTKELIPYIAIETAKDKYCKVAVWHEGGNYIYSAAVLGESIFYDGLCYFTHLPNCSVQPEILHHKDAKELLKKLKVKVTDVATKKYVRETLVKPYNIVCHITLQDGVKRDWVFYSDSEMAGRKYVCFVTLYDNGKVGEFVQKISLKEFQENTTKYFTTKQKV